MLFFATDGVIVEHHRETKNGGGQPHFQPTVWAHLTPHEISVPISILRRLTMKKVGIVMGSDSDLPIIKKATDTLTALDDP